MPRLLEPAAFRRPRAVRSTPRRPAGAAALLTLAALVASGCGRDAPEPAAARVEPPVDGTPRLVLFIVVDQCRADYLERFRPLLRFGLDRLLRESIVFADVRHDHAWTKTAPGHATLATGVHPSRHGIVSNEWYDRELGKVVDSDEDDRWDDDRSPHHLLVPTLADRMKELWPDAKVFGASGKSRGAILPAGRSADRAFWLDDETGRFLTSTYYGATEPAWLEAFHRDSFLDRRFGAPWEPLPEAVAAGAAYGIEPLDRGLAFPPLPRAIGRASVHPDEFYYEDVYWTPFIDRFLLEFAQTLLVEERLGADAYPDFLSLSFSALDLVGHAYGPDSIELLDTLLRLDRVLGELLDFVHEHVGLENTLVSLSADHGVSPVPEISIARGYAARRFGLEERLCVQSTDSRLDRELGAAGWFLDDFRLDPEAVAAAGLSQAEAEAAAARLIEQCPGVERAWTATELTSAGGADDPMRRLHRNNFYPGRSPDLLVQFEAWSVNRTDNTTTHGSPYPYDTRVPWLLRLPSGAGATVDEPALTVDVAPTLAALLRIEMPGELDGVDRSGAARQR